MHVEALDVTLEVDVARALELGIDGTAAADKLYIDNARTTELHLGLEGIHLTDIKIARANEGGGGFAGVEVPDTQIA